MREPTMIVFDHPDAPAIIAELDELRRYDGTPPLAPLSLRVAMHIRKNLRDMAPERVFPESEEPSSTPISTWTAVARALNVDRKTVQRLRKSKGETTPPYFASDEDAQAWWIALKSPPVRSPGRKQRKKPTSQAEGVVDWNTVKV